MHTYLKLAFSCAFISCCIPKKISPQNDSKNAVDSAGNSLQPQTTYLETDLVNHGVDQNANIVGKNQTPTALAGGEGRTDPINPHATNLDPRPFNGIAPQSADAESTKKVEPPFCADYVAQGFKENHKDDFANQNIEVWSLYSGGGFAGQGVGHFRVIHNNTTNGTEFYFFEPRGAADKPLQYQILDSEFGEFKHFLAEEDYKSPVIFCPAVMDAFAFSYEHIQYPPIGEPLVMMMGSFFDIDAPGKPAAVTSIMKAFLYLKNLKMPPEPQ